MLLTLRSGRQNPILALSPAAYYPFAQGITVTGAGVSQWDDQSGNGRHLLQGTDGNRPAYSGGIITFDGVDNYLKTNAFTLNQPETIYLVVNQVSWTSAERIFDGNAANTGMLQQDTATPKVRLFAGLGTTPVNGPAIGAFGVVACVFNGANSLIQVGTTSSSEEDASSANMGGFTLGANAGATIFSNIAVKEAAIFPVAHDAATRSLIITYLAAKHGIAL